MSNQKKLVKHNGTLLEKARGAFLGAAIGDALGWPQENRSQRLDKIRALQYEGDLRQFTKWSRRAGGRFYAHEELILPGEYSDDTQLILSVARSLLFGSKWLDYFAAKELPAWTLYERGGGGATKRAAAVWATGKAPWAREFKLADRRRYFDAGGNGVAMRILPHCLVNIKSDNFEPIARDIFANGICTHGHPRALVGALAYGFAVWKALQQVQTIEYGKILDLTIDGCDVWSIPPDISSHVQSNEMVGTWTQSAQEVTEGQYEQTWSQVVKETGDLLRACREANSQGALSVDGEVLKSLGCFDRRINGAGTVAAASAVFLASQYAADPVHEILRAAFADGADTDTLACMTGCILGSIHGAAWLAPYVGHLQDSEYLRKVAEQMVDVIEVKGRQENIQSKLVRKAELDSFLSGLWLSEQGSTVLLPDGRDGRVLEVIRHTSIAKSTRAVSWKILTTDGQSLYVKELSREGNKPTDQEKGKLLEDSAGDRNDQIDTMGGNIGIKLKVHDLELSKSFYGNVLGLKITKETSRSTIFGRFIALVPATGEGTGRQNQDQHWGSIICIETKALSNAFERVQKGGWRILLPITTAQSQGRLFRCLDPDRNVVEVFEIDKAT